MTKPTTLSPFHLAFPVQDLNATRRFYLDIIGCREGRSSEQWIDFDLFGHQIVAHQVEADKPVGNSKNKESENSVDGHDVPVPHFGVVLEWEQWQTFAERLKAENVKFAIAPYVRFEGQVGEQATMFFRDPSGNALEFKAFKDPEQIFAK